MTDVEATMRPWLDRILQDTGPLELAFETEERDGVIPLPGVMSRKKQVAPKVLAVL